MLRNITCALSGVLAAGLLLAGTAAWAQPRTLILGGREVLRIREADVLQGRQMSIDDRIAHVHDMMAAYLGGRGVRVTSQPWRDRVHLHVDGRFLLAVTPQDAAATGHPSAESLAPVWQNAIQRSITAGAAQQ
jgi:hypothetical protein